uniref:Uncharacterized protein n=1 Tax=Lepeophtheirus salmonis TaxID=72036 RepID=A0A0K2ULS7_LEPSM
MKSTHFYKRHILIDETKGTQATHGRKLLNDMKFHRSR